MKITYLGHSFFNIAFPKTNLIIDPFIQAPKDADAGKYTKPDLSKLGAIDLVLITHEHFDHFDKNLVSEIANRHQSFVVSHESTLSELSIAKNLQKPISAGKEITVKGVNIKACQAHHPESFYPLGYLISADNQSIYHAGDTELHDSFGEIKTDIALLPIGGAYTMDVVDAVRATKTMKPKYVIPMHYNTFDEIKADSNEFCQRINKSILKTKPIVMGIGETVEL